MRTCAWFVSTVFLLNLASCDKQAALPATSAGNPESPEIAPAHDTAASAHGWLTDVDAALAQAKKENKAVLLEFTGSDWCAPCKVLTKKVFSKKEFIEAASKNFVLVELDLPEKDKAVKERNVPIAIKYGVETSGTPLPLVILLDAQGKEFSRFIAGALPSVPDNLPNMEQFLAHLDTELAKKPKAN